MPSLTMISQAATKNVPGSITNNLIFIFSPNSDGTKWILLPPNVHSVAWNTEWMDVSEAVYLPGDLSPVWKPLAIVSK